MLNSECLEVFNKYLVEVKKSSQNTLSSYMRDVRQFGDFMEAHTSESIVSATEDDLTEYIECREPLLRLSACMAYCATAAM